MAKIKTFLRFLKNSRLHHAAGHFKVGDVHEFEGEEDELAALLRGPEPMAEELSKDDVKAIKRDEERKAKAAAKAAKVAAGEEDAETEEEDDDKDKKDKDKEK